jgi:hypothetical protein
MVTIEEDSEGDRLTIARLEGRVAALEAALALRSRELRTLQRHLCPRDLTILSRLASGLCPVPSGPFEPELWDESTHLHSADVSETLRHLWSSLAVDHDSPPDRDGDEPR